MSEPSDHPPPAKEHDPPPAKEHEPLPHDARSVSQPIAQRDEADADAAKQRMATAYHEAGHAVMAFHLGRRIEKVTIAPGRLAGGGVRLGICHLQKGQTKASSDPLEDEVLILLAGMVAEARFTGDYCHRGAAQDLRVVRRLLLSRANNDRQLERLQRRLLDKTEHLLDDSGLVHAIQSVADALNEKTVLRGRAIRHLVDEARRRFT